MAEVLILDSEALSALAHARGGAEALRARAILQVAHEAGAHARVPAPVLAEVCRGGGRDAAIHRVLNGKGISVLNLDRHLAQRAGAMLAAAGLDSACAVDAFVVATAASLGSTVIATGDPDDLTRLSKDERHVRIWPI